MPYVLVWLNNNRFVSDQSMFKDSCLQTSLQLNVIFSLHHHRIEKREEKKEMKKASSLSRNVPFTLNNAQNTLSTVFRETLSSQLFGIHDHILESMLSIFLSVTS